MRKLACLFAAVASVIAVSVAAAQGPGGGPARRPAGTDDLVERMLEFDRNKDGTLTRDEVTDQRLLRLFDRADANKNGTVTKDELSALATAERSNDRGGPPGGGFGGPMMGPPPRPGEILPQMLQQRLNVTAAQRKKLDALQKDVDAKLNAILSVDQRAQLQEMRERGPGGFGPPGGGRRPGGPGGGPPRGDGPPPGEGPPPGGNAPF